MSKLEDETLLESSERIILTIVLEATLKHLIAEVASINRSPGEAQEFVENLRIKLEDLNRYVNSGGEHLDQVWQAKMSRHINSMLVGIQFKDTSR